MTAMADGGGRLREVLVVLADSGVALSREELLDALWLARRLPVGDGDAPLVRATAPRASGLRHVPPDTSRGAPTPANAPAQAAPQVAGGAELHSSAVPERTAGPGSHDTPVPAPPKALPLRIPEKKALCDELAVSRALRPLKQRRPSLYGREFDEAATAAALAETGLPDVVLRPAPERWFDLALVVDDGMSMLLWRRLVAELHAVLRRAGAFRVVRVHGLRTRGDDGPVLHARPFDPAAPALSPRVLADPAGRTLVLVVSDGMGAAWRDGRMRAVLATWAGHGPTAVVHTLPPRLWDGSGIRADRWQVTTRRRGSPTTDWTVTHPVLPPELAAFDGVPVPVLEPAAAPLATWARLVASPGGTALLPLLDPQPRPTTSPASPDDMRELQRFRDAASSEAYRLAAHLAAVAPVSVPVMHLVQAAVPWRADTAHLAEVFLGGLLRPVEAPQAGPLPPQHRAFDFTEPAREALLDAVPTAELLATGRNVGARLTDLAGHSADFAAWLAHRAGTDPLSPGASAFAEVGPRLLHHFGAPTVPEQPPVPKPPVPKPSGWGASDPRWQPLLPDDPRRLGRYTLHERNGSGARLLAYRGRDASGGEAVIRVPAPAMSREVAQFVLPTTVEALRRMDGRYAPRLLAQELDEFVPWIAEEVIRASDGSPAPRLEDVLATEDVRAAEGVLAAEEVRLDTARAALLAWHICEAVSLCHLKGMGHGDLSPATILVTGESVALTGWSAATQSEYPARSVAQRDIGRLGEILLLLGGYYRAGRGWGPASRWPRPDWRPVHDIIEACLDPDLGARPTARQVADAFVGYLPGEIAPPPGSPPTVADQPGTFRRLVARFRSGGPARGEASEQPKRQRRPDLTRTPHRIAVVGTANAGGGTVTALLGRVLATERQERVLATGVEPGIVSDTWSNTDHHGDWLCVHRSPHGLDILFYRSGWPFTATDVNYSEVIDEVGRDYSTVLTHTGAGWLNLRRGVFDHCDQLVVVASDRRGTSIADQLVEFGYRDLVRRSVGVLNHVNHAGAEYWRSPELRELCRSVVSVPYDEHLAARTALDLNQLRPATREAYYELAALVAEGFPRPTT